MWGKKETEEVLEKLENNWPSPKNENGCDHDICHECKHMIEKGSGQNVTEISMGYFYMMSNLQREGERTLIFCELHKKPYDRFENEDVGRYYKREARYEKRIEPWKRVNPDGTDYIEKTPEESSKDSKEE